jgi:hypothetical protein
VAAARPEDDERDARGEHEDADGEQADADRKEQAGAGADAHVGAHPRPPVGVHDQRRPLAVRRLPVDGLGAVALPAGDPEVLVGGRAGPGPAGRAAHGHRIGVDLADLVVRDPREVGVEIPLARDADEDGAAVGARCADAHVGRGGVDHPVVTAAKVAELQPSGGQGGGRGRQAPQVGGVEAVAVPLRGVRPDQEDPGEEESRGDEGREAAPR